MEQLNLLSSLETHHDLLKSYEKELVELEEKLKLRELERRIRITEGQLEKIKIKREETKKDIKTCNNMLIEYNYKIEEIDKSLYNGKTTDIKQLEYLSKEKERLMEIVSNRETELLDLMDELELIDKDIMQIEEFLQKYKDRIRKQRKKYSALEQKLKSKIEEEKQEIVSIEGNMNEILLEKYYSIKKNKGSGVSIPQNGVCNRCNMILPMILLDRLNKGEIVLCENCGRILCKQS
ncbi:MAG: hypothetical protein GX300_02645 [Tissierellia bacterium]|nr:hypothetical protein [Tissierellia bacterium]